MKNRYEFARYCYSNYVILILKYNKLYTYDNNKLINFKHFNKLKELHINYVILDNLDIIKYLEYYLKYSINKILKIMLDKMKGINKI